MNDTTEIIASIATAVIGVAIIAVIFSKKANTSGVISAAGSAFGGILGIAVSPITGSNAPSPGGQSVQFTNSSPAGGAAAAAGGITGNIQIPNITIPNIFGN